jgi:hypothetical protein
VRDNLTSPLPRLHGVGGKGALRPEPEFQHPFPPLTPII